MIVCLRGCVVVCLCTCGLVCLSVCLSFCLSLCLSLSVSVCLCLCLSVSVRLFVCLSVYAFIQSIDSLLMDFEEIPCCGLECLDLRCQGFCQPGHPLSSVGIGKRHHQGYYQHCCCDHFVSGVVCSLC